MIPDWSSKMNLLPKVSFVWIIFNDDHRGINALIMLRHSYVMLAPLHGKSRDEKPYSSSFGNITFDDKF